jgi:hypothetical protein
LPCRGEFQRFAVAVSRARIGTGLPSPALRRRASRCPRLLDEHLGRGAEHGAGRALDRVRPNDPFRRELELLVGLVPCRRRLGGLDKGATYMYASSA